MQFVMPSRYDMNTLPKPGDPSIKLEKSEGFWAVTMRYGGFNNDSKFQKHKEILDDYIRQNDLPSSGELYFLGYDPPFRMVGRTNEILVK
ncbi:MAG: heme-binding protein, partial [Cryomorphaceae bacterium]